MYMYIPILTGATIFPVCPTCISLGTKPASTAALDAPTTNTENGVWDNNIQSTHILCTMTRGRPLHTCGVQLVSKVIKQGEIFAIFHPPTYTIEAYMIIVQQ